MSISASDVIVGSYSLESLTTGMYENPLHCVREYVQNGYDAIRAARVEQLIAEDEGTVAIAISGSPKRPTLTITDDGIGISAADAVMTLVSLGASQKRSNVNAGFRGIGRLAGIAYCGTLRFTTTMASEEVATVVEFDCGRLRGFMRPSAEVQDVREVIRLSATTTTQPAPAEKHGTDVEMIGLTGVGIEFAEIEKLVPYLRQVCPTEYSDRFSQAPRIRTFATSVGYPIGAIDVETRYKRERTQILKAYDDVTPTSDARRPSTVRDVEFLNSAELGWHGWIGKSNFKGELTDDQVAGVRFRVKNIQIDGSDLIETLGAELTQGGTEGRLQRYAVGEIFITNPAVVPNARRDGFEDSKAWAAIRADVKLKVARRVITLVREASTSRRTLKQLKAEIDGVDRALKAEWLEPSAADNLSGAIARLLGRLKPEKLTGGDPDEVGGYISKLKTLRDRLAELRTIPRPQREDEEETREADDDDLSGDGPGDDETEEGGSQDEGVDAGNEHADGPWPADQLLAALERVLVREHGATEAGRLLMLAKADLAAGES